MIIRKVFRKIARKISVSQRKADLMKQGVSFLEPNYIFFDVLNEDSVVMDVGCGSEAELARYMIEKYSAQAFGVDPTRKHATALKVVENNSSGKFKHIDKAVAHKKGMLVFSESVENESGSLLESHNNVKYDHIEKYEVEAVELSDLKALTSSGVIDFLKLDLEGAEYELLKNIDAADLAGIAQLFVEFHHHCIDEYDEVDTRAVVARIESFGMKSLTIDNHNYLFYHEADSRFVF